MMVKLRILPVTAYQLYVTVNSGVKALLFYKKEALWHFW